MTPRWYISVAVVVAGGCCLAVEILGTRLLAPFYGASLYLWSATIGVTLGALSLGYALGGRWADRGARLGRLCVLLAAAGIWIAAAPWVRRPILAMTEPLGLRGAVLVASVLLFLSPLALLGMALPYAVRLRTTALDVVGRATGDCYALSTLAGAVTAILTSFVLIPLVGASPLAFLVGVALVVTALIGAATSRARRVPAVVAAAAAIAAAVIVAPKYGGNQDAGLIAIEESPYGEIRVVEKDDLRLMLIDGMVQTEVDAKTLAPRSPYVDVLDLADGFFESRGRALIVGLGGGSLAKLLADAGWSVDAVEIDPAVTQAALRHFGLEPSQARVYHMDGREYLAEHDFRYDLIVVDAFGSGSIPFHLVSREAFAECKAHLAPGGVMALNVMAVGWRDTLVRSLAATLGREFSQVIALPMAEPPDQLGNLVLFASDRELELSPEPPVPLDRFSPEYTRAHAWDNRFTIDPAGERVITDDRNPVDLWTEHINLANRRALHEYFGSSRAGW